MLDVLHRYGAVPEQLSKVVIMLPNQRSVRTVQEVFLRVSGGEALLLPQLISLSDIDDGFVLRWGRLSSQRLQSLYAIPPAISSERRIFLLMQLVNSYAKQQVFPAYSVQRVELAKGLASLIDDMHREQASWEALASLAPEEYAEQWQDTITFLELIGTQWPSILKEEGVIDPWDRRNQILAILAQAWRDNPPTFPIFIAGTTGSVPATADLMKVVGELEGGAVILPGFDSSLPVEESEELGDSHPQHGMYRLLERFQVSPKSVLDMDNGRGTGGYEGRLAWLQKALLPPRFTGEWRQSDVHFQHALKDMYYLECENSQNEAHVISLLLREALETAGKTAALVTTDRSLAERVKHQLKKWNIHIDDSAGVSLLSTPHGQLANALLEASAQPLSPVSILALLKHPLFRMERPAAEVRSLARALEREVLRGVKPGSFTAVREKLKPESELSAFVEEVEQVCHSIASYITSGKLFAVTEFLSVFARVLEHISRTEEGRSLFHSGDEADHMARFMEALYQAASGIEMEGYDITDCVRAFLRQTTYRPAYGTHPRLQILSPMESRLQQFDLVVLGAMNEESWPQAAESNPWLNRVMMKHFGLPSPEQKIGLLAHDFVQLAGSGEVVLTRSVREGGAVISPSRFIVRMEALLELAHVAGREAWKAHPVLEWVNQELRDIDAKPCRQPAPTPPVSARPRSLAFTRIERLLRDPYSIYAQYILRLKPLDDLEQALTMREFGVIVHDAFDAFAKQNGWKQAQPKEWLLHYVAEALKQYGEGLGVYALWKPRFEQIAEWFLAQPYAERVLSEVRGEWVIATPAGDFKVFGTVDRIDLSEHGLTVLDYKTGQPPSQKEIALGLANQLLIAAVMVEEGAFGDEAQHKPIESLEYWHLKGGRDGGAITAIKPAKDSSLGDMISHTRDALPRLIALFDQQEMAYLSLPDWRNRPRYNDYEHLARISEWASS